MAKLFETVTIRNTTFKNRIVMAPMCMYSSKNEDGMVEAWHQLHYTARAVGQVGLIMLEATAVHPQGRISSHDLGIWDDNHIEGLSKLVNSMKIYGSKTAIQLAHAGRKATVDGPIVAPSAFPFSETYRTPKQLTIAEIKELVEDFKQAAIRAKTAGFDVLELHAAHGYLINSFLSPLTNERTDEYGGNAENRYRFLREIIDTVRSIWDGPLFVRISAEDYTENGMTTADYIEMAEWMKEQTVDLIDVSSGGVVLAKIDAFPGYQVPYAGKIKNNALIPTSAVGLITTGEEAEEVLTNGEADLIFIGRALLRNPYWPYEAAKTLNYELEAPEQYKRGWL